MSEIAEHADEAIVILKSTVVPGTCKKINNLYPGINLVFSPEFLTEKNSVNDFKECNRVIFSGNESDTLKCEKTFKKVFPNNYIITGTEDFVWGKTGTLKNNHNYSGYIVTDKGRQYVFSIMINHFTDDLDIIKGAILDFLKYIKSNA